MNNNQFELIKKLRWLLVLPIAVLFAFLFARQSLNSFFITAFFLYLISLLFAYEKASWLVFFILSIVPTLTTSIILQVHHSFTMVDSLLFCLLFLLSLGLSYAYAIKKKIIERPRLKDFPIGKIMMGLLLLFVVSAMTSVIGQAIHTTNTQNQDQLNQLKTVIPIGIFALQTIFAGFFEELTYRVGIFEIIFKKHRILAFCAAAFIFAYMHGPTDLYSWLVYGALSIVLTGLYAKYRNFYLNMSVHMLWNAIGLLLALL
ncbi:CPBP family intramembrane glutamic endopeptidase [Lactococcus sp.]|uniref:CPBP family intramembrane glutamic endopeptidase n=1 Tax=Lactococcus sp. TaxID=44273 RepID=UPI0035AEF0AE